MAVSCIGCGKKNEKAEDADLIITGEGRMDRQSLMGKIPGRILQAGQLQKIPVIGITGMVEEEKLLKEAGFQNIYATKPKDMSIVEAMKKKVAIKNIKSVIQSVMK